MFKTINGKLMLLEADILVCANFSILFLKATCRFW